MYIHLQSTRVFPSDATSDSFPTSPLFPFSLDFFSLKDQLGFGVFLYCFRLLEAEPCLGGRDGQYRVRVVQAGWLGRC